MFWVGFESHNNRVWVYYLHVQRRVDGLIARMVGLLFERPHAIAYHGHALHVAEACQHSGGLGDYL